MEAMMDDVDPYTGRPCSVDDCGEPRSRRQWCNIHYRRWLRHGDPTAYKPRTRPGEPMRFLRGSLSVDTDDCVEWPYADNSVGYGVLNYKGRMRLATRALFDLMGKPLSDAEIVRHACDNPPCINPKHLSTGTQADNNRDMVERGRHTFGERDASAKLTEAQVRQILQDEGTIDEIAENYPVTRSTIHLIRTGQMWRHITAPNVDANGRTKKLAADVHADVPSCACPKCRPSRVGVDRHARTCIRLGECLCGYDGEQPSASAAEIEADRMSLDPMRSGDW